MARASRLDPAHRPASTLVEISALVAPTLKVEIEAEDGNTGAIEQLDEGSEVGEGDLAPPTIDDDVTLFKIRKKLLDEVIHWRPRLD